MTQSHRMGWPAALNCIPLETRKAHVTPPRQSIAACFVEGDSTDQDITKFYGAASGGSASSERWAAEGSEASPPSTTDKPQGVWVKTSERKPPVGAVRMTRCCSVGVEGDERSLTWTGKLWRSEDSNVGSEWSREWLDTTPSNQEDDGWVTLTPGGSGRPPAAGTYIDLKIKWSHTDAVQEYKGQLYDPEGRAWRSGEILAYRIVKDQA